MQRKDACRNRGRCLRKVELSQELLELSLTALATVRFLSTGVLWHGDSINTRHCPGRPLSLTSRNVSQYVVHHDPRWWKDAERFDPDRWLPDAPTPPKGAYFPYGNGPRICIGNHFATALLRVAVGGCLRRFELRPSAEGGVTPQPLTTLRPKGGLLLSLQRRSSGNAQA